MQSVVFQMVYQMDQISKIVWAYPQNLNETSTKTLSFAAPLSDSDPDVK